MEETRRLNKLPKLNVSNFSGNYGEDVIEWIRVLKRNLINYGVAKNDWVRAGANYLEGYASNAFENWDQIE